MLEEFGNVAEIREWIDSGMCAYTVYVCISVCVLISVHLLKSAYFGLRFVLQFGYVYLVMSAYVSVGLLRSVYLIVCA